MEEYELICRDECGQEMVIIVGTRAECQEELKRARENYAECTRFQVQMSAREMAQFRSQQQEEYDDMCEREGW